MSILRAESARTKLDNLTREIVALKVNCLLTFLTLGEKLKEVKDGNYWMADGNYKTFFQYCETEVKLKRTQVFAAMACWERYGRFISKHDGLTTIDHTRLVRLLPYVTEANMEEMLHMAATVDVQGFENNLKNFKGKKGNDECGHPGELERWWRCPECGKFIKDVSEEGTHA